MKTVLYITIYPTPFQYEFTNGVKNHLKSKARFVVLYERKLPEFRKHWGDFNNGLTLSNEQSIDQQLDTIDPDILIFTQYNSRVTRSGVFWARKKHRHFYLGPHEIIRRHEVHPLKRWLKLRYYKFIANGVQGIATMGQSSVSDISRLVPNVRVESIPYSFSLTKLKALERKSTEKGLYFLISGRLSEFRNPILAIESFAHIVARNPSKKVHLIISGTGDLYDQCIKLIEDSNIGHLVTWENDFEDWYDIHNIYAKAHVLLALQNYGTWGLVIQEAMAAGLGIISTVSIQSALDNIIHEYNGFMVCKHKETIIRYMQKYVDDSGLSLLHGDRSRDIVDFLDVDNSSAKFCSLLAPSIDL